MYVRILELKECWVGLTLARYDGIYFAITVHMLLQRDDANQNTHLTRFYFLPPLWIK